MFRKIFFKKSRIGGDGNGVFTGNYTKPATAVAGFINLWVKNLFQQITKRGIEFFCTLTIN